MKKKFSIIVFSSLLVTTQPVFSEAIGLPYARSSNVETHEYLTVEGGIQLGLYDNYVGRATVRMGDNLSVYGDLGIYDIDRGSGYHSETGLSLGAGGLFSLGQFGEVIDAGVLASFHLATTDNFTITDFAIRGQASTAFDTAQAVVTLYGSVGLEFLNVEYDNCVIISCDASSTEFAIGGGAAYPIGQGEAFASIEIIEDFSLGFGYRMGF